MKKEKKKTVSTAPVIYTKLPSDTWYLLRNKLQITAWLMKKNMDKDFFSKMTVAQKRANILLNVQWST